MPAQRSLLPHAILHAAGTMFNLADTLLATVPLPALKYEHTHWVRGATPLSTQPVVVAALVAYLVVIFGIREFMKNRNPLKLQYLFQAHNVLLSSGSLLLLSLMVEEVAPMVWKHGIFWGMCDEGMWTNV